MLIFFFLTNANTLKLNEAEMVTHTKRVIRIYSRWNRQNKNAVEDKPSGISMADNKWREKEKGTLGVNIKTACLKKRL